VTTFAVLGFTIGSEKATHSYRETFIIAIGYLVFSVGSFFSLWYGQSNLVTFAKHAVAISKTNDMKATIIELHVLPVFAVLAFQLLIVVAVLFATRITYVARKKD
jgi:hypothetical protein